jgi:outer membrane protein assembly factor BamA
VSRGHARARVHVGVRRTPAGADLCLRVDEGPAFRVGSVRVTGQKTLKAQDVQGVLQTRAGGLFKPEVLERDVLSLTALCYEHGLITCRISEPKPAFDEKKGRVTITIAVQEGSVFRLGKVGFTGKLASPSAYRWLFQTRPGDIFIRSNLQADIARIQDWHREKGQGEVMVTPQSTIHTDQRTVDILFEVEPGAQP